MKTKQCNECKAIKPIAEFRIRKTGSRDGHRGICKECERQRYKLDERKTTPVKNLCLVCGKNFEGRKGKKYCSLRCGNVYRTRRNEGRQDYGQAIKCSKCGNEQIVLKRTGGKPKTVCNKCKKQQKRLFSKEEKRRRRARKYQVQYERVNPNTIFERDNWTCYLCGKATPKQLRGLGKPASPQLDHVVPLARGGSHTKNNLACACRECNIKKGALTVEEYVQGRAY